jgi:23S rRNA (uridine2552-2'-O)-methyltransferase
MPPPRRPGGRKPIGSDRGVGTQAGRALTVRVRRARNRKPSSTEWLSRQLNDPYVAEAQRLGYRSRAAFKLLQLDERFHLLAPGRRVLDLGCAPGGWTQIAVERAGDGRGVIVGIDLAATDPVAGATLLRGDFREADTAAAIRTALAHGERRGGADLVLSDMAAPTTGHTATDHLRIIALAEDAFAFAETILAPGGAFVAKVFQGGTEGELLATLKQAFAEVRHAKPAASRAESAETYVVAQGYRGATEASA